jgi:hypothetical protein
VLHRRCGEILPPQRCQHLISDVGDVAGTRRNVLVGRRCEQRSKPVERGAHRRRGGRAVGDGRADPRQQLGVGGKIGVCREDLGLIGPGILLDLLGEVKQGRLGGIVLREDPRWPRMQPGGVVERDRLARHGGLLVVWLLPGRSVGVVPYFRHP